MLAPLAIALLLVVLCLAAGRLVLHLLGATRPTWLAGAVGFAALTVAAALLIRLPGRGATAAVVLVLALAAGLVATRRSLVPRGARAEHPVAGAHAGGLIVIAVVGIAAWLPFLIGGHTGVLGEGIYTNDHAAQLYWTDWLQNGFGPEPSAVAFGYPVGPQSLVAVIAEATGTSLLNAFNGLLVAIPVLTALAALAALENLRPLPRVATAALSGLPFLAASFLAQSAFKETAMALLVLAFAVTLALATEGGGLPGSEPGAGQPGLGGRAAAGAAALIALAGVLTYSAPALAWFGLTLVAWLGFVVAAGDRALDWGAISDAISRRRVPLAIAAVLLIVVLALTAGRISDFADRIGDVQASTGRLSSPVWPGEALAIWPEGDFRVVRGDVDGSLLASALGALVVAAGAFELFRRRAFALLAALGACAAVYIGARAFASIYVEAKALAVMAPLVVVIALGGLLGAGGRRRALLAALGVVAALAAGTSTFLALREAPVGFDDRGAELEELAGRAGGEAVAFLGVDRFGAYWLRGTLVESPGGYVPPEVRARPEKVWQQGDPMDLDTLPAKRLDDFDYAVTTTAAYQSSPAPNWHEASRTDSYVLWKREGPTPRLQVLSEDGDPGAALQCPDDTPEAAASEPLAAVLPEPVVAPPEAWSTPSPFDAPGTATTSLRLRPGTWQLSMQYHSQVDLNVEAGDLQAELPASLVGMYLTHQGQGAFWPVGEITVPAGDGDVDVRVTAAEPTGLERATGATRRAWLGELAATRLNPIDGDQPAAVATARACGDYVDHLGGRAALATLSP